MTPGRCTLLAARPTRVHRRPVSFSFVHCPFERSVMVSSYRLLLVLLPLIVPLADAKPATKDNAPAFNSWQQLGLGKYGQGTLAGGVDPLSAAGNVASSVLATLGLQADGKPRRAPAYSETRSLPEAAYQSDGGLANFLGNSNTVDLQGIASGQIPGLAPIPVPGFPGPQDVPTIPGVNTIPGLSNFNYLVGQLIPQVIPPTNTLLGSSISRLLPQDSTKNLAKDVFRAVHPAAEDVEVERMMGRWFQVINSPHVIREACTVSHFGALTNNTYSATFTVLKFYREGNPNGPPRFSLGYGFTAGDHGQFVLHNSNSPDAEPFWVIKKGPLNEFNQYDYAVISNWVRFPVFVIARDPERFQKVHMRQVLQFLEDNNYINVMTKAFNMISPVDYSQCQYTPTFSGAG